MHTHLFPPPYNNHNDNENNNVDGETKKMTTTTTTTVRQPCYDRATTTSPTPGARVDGIKKVDTMPEMDGRDPTDGKMTARRWRKQGKRRKKKKKERKKEKGILPTRYLPMERTSMLTMGKKTRY